MKSRLLLLSLATVCFVLAGCSKPEGSTVAQKRTSVGELKDVTLAELYQKKPAAREEVAKSAGYGVFSNMNINLLLLSSGNGYGVVHDNATKKDTYMRMQMIGYGVGAGVKDFRAVIIFKNPQAMHKFVNEGWEFGGHADVAAVSGEKGGAASEAAEVTGDMEIYNFTETGIALQATIAGTKYWKDPDMN